MTKRGFALTAVLAMTLAFPAQAQDRSFTAEGSDAIFAMGARHIAMGGTGTSTADDALAVFYNPARLAGIRQYSFSGTRQLDATLRPYAFIGGTVPLSFLEPLGIEATFGVARYNRVHARSSGAFAENEFESIFLRYLLPGISGTFDGDIDSKTLVNRFALGTRFDDLPGLSIGANVDWIDCKTDTCGMHGGSNGYEVRTTHATALSYGFSLNYAITDRVTFGANYTDVNTTLKVDSTVTDNLGTRADTYYVNLPRKLNLELSMQVTDRLLLATGYQKLWGTYGNFDLNIETAHFGAEFESREGLIWRGGAWMPLDISASNGL
ncbi:MAG: hypothetical protein P8X51_16355 [Maritimibacter sp.]